MHTIDKKLIFVEAVIGNLKLSVRGLCGAVTVWEVVDYKLDDLSSLGVLLDSESFVDVGRNARHLLLL